MIFENIRNSIHNKIIDILIKSTERMINDKEIIDNKENAIRDILYEKYLNNNNIRKQMENNNFIFDIESPENFDNSSKKYIGRVDIKVLSINTFNDTSDYYIIECKRIDGTNILNKKYIDEGISRFVVEPIKYKTKTNRNIMFGFIVKDINIRENTIKIKNIHSTNEYIKNNISEDFIEERQHENIYSLYRTSYYEHNIKLFHIFYNISKIIIE